MRILRWISTLPLRLRSVFRRDRVEAEMDEELRYHLESQVALNVAHGMSPEAARDAAMRAMGNVERHREQIRETRRVEWISALVQDARYGVRLVRRAPGFAAAAISTVALGIASTTVIFSVAYGVLMKSLPFEDPSRLVNIWATMPKWGLPRAYVTAANARDLRRRNNVVEDLAIVRSIGSFNLVEGGEPERLQGARFTSNLLPILGVAPMLGRGFTDDEDDVGRDNVVLLSYGVWKRRFAADPSIVGRKLSLNGIPHLVAGVMGPDFAYPSREFQLWTPLAITDGEYQSRHGGNYRGVARLKPGVTVAQANADFARASAQLTREYPESNDGVGAEVVAMLDDTVDRVERPLIILLGAVAALLLIGCANLANLLFARALARHQELAVRAALGASRRRLMAHALGELSPILVLGGALGIAAAAALLRAAVPLLPADLPRAENIGLSLPVLGVSAMTLVLIAVVAGFWPALISTRTELAATMRDSSRTNTGSSRPARVRDGLVISQIAITLLLFVGAMVLMRSFVNLRRVDPGFDPSRVLTAHVAISRTKYASDAAVADVSHRFMERIRTLPRVESVGMINRLPLAGGTQTASLEFEGVDPTRGKIPAADLRTATPDYFSAMRIPLRDGRVFSEGDDARTTEVGLIDDRLARRVFGDASPVGRRFRVDELPWVTIVGVVGHVRHAGLDDGEDARSQVYWNYRQRTQDRTAFAIRTSGDPSTLIQPLAAAIREIDPAQPLYDVRLLEEVVVRSLSTRWFQTAVIGAFAVMALLLASIGVYGVIAYGVSQRFREFGVRMALGARRGDVVALVFARGARLMLAGVVLGLVVAVASVQVLTTLVFGMRPLDGASFAIATAVMLGSGAAACYLPARRAARADPSVALRSE